MSNVRKCHDCGGLFGTVSGFTAHRGVKGCKSSRSLERYEGMWRGHSDVWWTPDLGHDDTTDDWANVAA